MYTQVRSRKTKKCANIVDPHLKYNLQLKTKEGVVSTGLGTQSGGKQYTWRWKSNYLVNRYLLSPAETIGPERNFDIQTLLGSSLSTHLSSYYSYLWW